MHPFAPRLTAFAQVCVISVPAQVRSVVQAGVVLPFSGKPPGVRVAVACCLAAVSDIVFSDAVVGGKRYTLTRRSRGTGR